MGCFSNENKCDYPDDIAKLVSNNVIKKLIALVF